MLSWSPSLNALTHLCLESATGYVGSTALHLSIWCAPTAATISRIVNLFGSKKNTQQKGFCSTLLSLPVNQGIFNIHTLLYSLLCLSFDPGGWRAFYQGNGTNLLKIAPESAVRFTVFEYLRDHLDFQPVGAAEPTVSAPLLYGGKGTIMRDCVP